MKKTHVVAVAVAAILIVAVAVGVALVNSSSPSQSQGSGQLSVMGTDPAVAAQGVTDATLQYSSVQAHTAGSSMASGWTQVSGSGSLDLMAGQGTATTLATSKVNAGTYDAFRFDVDSVKVTYQGEEYTATSATTTVTAQSQSRVEVNSSSSATALVDLRTFVVNTGSSSSPQFIFSASAAATAVPSSALLSVSVQIGSTADLSAQAWWNAFISETSTNVQVQGTVSGGAMHLTVQNTGSADADVQAVVVSPVSASLVSSTTLPSSLSGSAVFTVNSAGSFQQTASLQSSALVSSGATVASDSSANFTYNGTISLDFGSAVANVTVVTGQEYLVTVIGANTYANAIVVAS